MSEDKIQSTKETMYKFSKIRTLSDMEQTILRHGANAIEQLQQENEELKLTLKGTTHCFDEEEHQRLNNILNEFEKLLEKQKKKLNTSNDFDRYARLIIIESLDKLQELKEGKK